MKKTLSLALCVVVIMLSLVACKQKKKDETTIDCSGLAVSATVTGSTATPAPTGGTAPYQYSVDGATYVTETQITGLHAGSNTIYVKDANSCTANTTVTVNQFTDSRDNQSYATVTIGTQTWMAQNLNYNAAGSLCYSTSSDSCTKYGKLYDGATALTVCPNGYHLPSDSAWKTLEVYLGMTVADANITSTSAARGTDQGTKLLVGGSSGFNTKFSGAYNGNYVNIGVSAALWSGTESSIAPGYYYIRGLNKNYTGVFRYTAPNTNNYYCVRCLKD